MIGADAVNVMTYQIHRYPAELVDVVQLSDGARVVIRPVLPQDRELISTFFDDLTADARCNRFMHPVREPSSELLRQFTQVDYANHVALIAEVFADGRETVIGEARYVCGADPSAEISVSVSEAWRGKGLAKLMLTKLECRAAAAGVRRFIGYTFASNEKMLSLARKVGFSEGIGDVVDGRLGSQADILRGRSDVCLSPQKQTFPRRRLDVRFVHQRLCVMSAMFGHRRSSFFGGANATRWGG